MAFGDKPEGSKNDRRRKRYHRHDAYQIQQLEALFKECPHPDENQRAELSRELGLHPRQIKFWFQNRRTQMKTQNERADNCFLRAENDRIRCENIAMREALKNAICPNCGSPPVVDESFDEQKLRLENARLKEELERMSNITSKYLGRSFTQMPTMPVSSMDLPVGGMSGPAALGTASLDSDLPGGRSSGMPFQMSAAVTEMERPMMIDTALRALEELIELAQAGDHIWVKGLPVDGRETLNVATYDSFFKPGAGLLPPDISVEGSRDSGIVFMSAIALVDVFMDTNKWMEFFPGIVSKAQTVDVLLNGLSGRNESLIMMYEELHVMTPVIPARGCSFLRYCKQIDQDLWAVVDVSIDAQQRSRRLPSGCLIADLSNGYSKVIWVEHMEIEQMLPVNVLFQNIMLSGAAFGAHRWLAALQRACDRFAVLAALGVPHHDPSGVTAEGKRSMMKLSQRMLSSFAASLASSPKQQWTHLPGNPDVSVRAFMHSSVDPGQPGAVVLAAATSLWLPVPCDLVAAFLRDENLRSQWDVMTYGNPYQEVSRITNGVNPGNCISLLQTLDSDQNSVLTLQECCTDASGSLLVYSSIDVPAATLVMCGEDTSSIPLLPSGFAIVPDCPLVIGAAGASSSAAPPAGCVLTAAFQVVLNNATSPSCVAAESVATMSTLITTAVLRVRAALTCVGP